MAKDIEKLIESFVVPEMEYSPLNDKLVKNGGYGVTIDDVPEVVLPKTKAEMLEEAKERLSGKTAASSGGKKRARAETAAAAEPTTVTLSRPDNKPPVREKRVKLAASPSWVGGADELVPFAWRMPLVADIKNPNKLYRRAVMSPVGSFLPGFHNNK